MILQHSTWSEIEAYLGRSRGVMIPIGSTEQHGPNGPIGTDAICAEAVARSAAADADILVGPTLAVTTAQFNLRFPGTISLRSTTLMAVVTDYVRSLAAQGFARFYFLNGHGANIAPLLAAFHDLHGEHAATAPHGLRCRLRSWWEYPDANALRQSLYGEWEGIHATPSEIAIAHHAVPATQRPAPTARPEKLTAASLREMGGDRHFDADHHRARFPDGRIGSDPALVGPTDGARLLAAAAAGARADYAAFLAEA
ncbi:MAG: creatininase family protein [Alphaproteobacteria bacterium]|nr:creatininase family protein [Alphaproteobacteria bacterium]